MKYNRVQKFLYTCMNICMENEDKTIIYRNKPFSGLDCTNVKSSNVKSSLIQVKIIKYMQWC